MSTEESQVATALREQTDAIGRSWLTHVLATIPELHDLPPNQLVDHLPEFLDGLAVWVLGDVTEARERFQLLADGHAMQRQSAGIPLEAMTSEYAALRSITLRTLLGIEAPRALIKINEGFDVAVYAAVHRYAQARDEVRERFIGILGHDLRDPLAAVAMSASFLRESRLDDRQRDLVAKIERGTDRIAAMISDVLDFTRGKLGSGIPISPVASDMAAICRAAADEIAAARTTQIDLDLRGDLRGAFDAERAKQALANLLGNAVQYGTGPIQLRAWEREDRRAIFTSVTNRGEVIAPDRVRGIFDPFKLAAKRRGKGLGLGLYIVQQIAVAHGGVCRVTSTREDGTTFSIEWPRVPLEQTPGRPLG
jgi:signal transduction histidine kinase